MNDKELVSRMQHGDMQAFDELYERYKDDVFVAVNGERVQIRRGETVRIKRKFAQVLEQRMRQDTATARLMEQKAAEYEANAKALNL